MSSGWPYTPNIPYANYRPDPNSDRKPWQKNINARIFKSIPLGQHSLILFTKVYNLLDFLNENNQWFVLEDKSISPGMYRIKDEKIINSTYEPMVLPKDQIKIYEDLNFPVGSVFGMDIYQATHVKTNQRIYITTSEIYK